jgi:hypothetical protein
MGMSRKLRQIAWWGAFLAVAVTVWSATFSYLLAPAQDRGNATLVEICTSHGPVWLDQSGQPDEGQSGGSGSLSQFEHCPLCVLRDVMLLPAFARVIQPVAQYTYFFPPLFFAAPRPLFAWSPASPRAPPVFA